MGAERQALLGEGEQQALSSPEQGEPWGRVTRGASQPQALPVGITVNRLHLGFLVWKMGHLRVSLSSAGAGQPLVLFLP